MQHDRTFRSHLEFDISIEVFTRKRIFEAPGDGILGKTIKQAGHVIIGAVHGEVIVQAKTLRCDALHRFGLIDDILEG